MLDRKKLRLLFSTEIHSENVPLCAVLQREDHRSFIVPVVKRNAVAGRRLLLYCNTSRFFLISINTHVVHIIIPLLSTFAFLSLSPFCFDSWDRPLFCDQ